MRSGERGFRGYTLEIVGDRRVLAVRVEQLGELLTRDRLAQQVLIDILQGRQHVVAAGGLEVLVTQMDSGSDFGNYLTKLLFNSFKKQ